MSALLTDFVVNMDKIADFVIGSEGHPLVNQACPCGKGTRTTRCKDCLDQAPTCDTCYLNSHTLTPFHFAEKWNGRYFERSTQASLGRIVYFGHNGSRCPHLHKDAKPLMLDVVDLNGVHSCKVLYCDCPSSEKKWEQLLQVELFPGTMRSPSTAFTFAVLKHFDTLSSISKAAAMDFVTTLRRATNNAFIDDVPVSYVPVNAIYPILNYFEGFL